MEPHAPPCMVLEQIREDLIKIVKQQDLPVQRTYTLKPGIDFEISISKSDDTQFHLEVKVANALEHAVEPNFRKLAGQVPVLTWKALSDCLVRCEFTPCESMTHEAADELLALYQCIELFKKAATLPFTKTVQGPKGSYELFSARENGSHCDMVFETNYIYGNKLKFFLEVEFLRDAPDRAQKILSVILREWLRPDYISTMRAKA